MLINYTLQYDRNGTEVTSKDISQGKSGKDI